MRRLPLLLGLALLAGGCGATAPPAKQRRAGTPPAKPRRAGGGIPPSLLAEVRPIGRGPRFEPPVRGSVPGPCRAALGQRSQAHIEVFGANRVVLLPAGIGTLPPRRLRDGRLTHTSCFGALVTLDPTGVVYFRAGQRLTVGDLFSAWGARLGARQIASFTGGRVRVYVNGRPRAGSPRTVPLVPGAEIVLEVGPRVPPHSRFAFPAAPPATLH